jgi:hypothetical protein
MALWWGLLTVAIAAYLLNVAQPLRSGPVAAAGCLLILAMGVPGWLLLGRRPRQRAWAIDRRMAAVIIALAIAQGYLALAALGQVTNYDSGLYHLGAIRYAGEYATIPGLANLYFAFGYGNAEFPLAAVLSNGPWGFEGFRLLNGLILLLVAIDLALRVARRRFSPGLFVLAVGIATAWVPMLALSDYWVTSPTQDSAVFALSVVTVAYLADAAVGGLRWVGDAATAAVLSVLLVMLRPTMAVFALVALGVMVVRAWRLRGTGLNQRLGAATGAILAAGALAAAAVAARDYVLSGWLQYPLSIYSFDVPWRAPDPTPAREATLGFARDPSNLWQSVQTWDWIGTWVRHLPTQWETYEFLAMLVVAIVLISLVQVRFGSSCRWRALVVAMVPSVAAVITWFVTSPPAFRFIWGPLFTIAALPIGWCLWLLSTRTPDERDVGHLWPLVTAVGVSVPIVAVAAFSLLVRFDFASITEDHDWVLGVSIPYSTAPIRSVPVASSTLPTGLTVLMPRKGDQCWTAYPLCTPQISDTVRLRGASLQEGLLP